MNVVDNNEYIDLYNFSSLITEDDNKEIMIISKSIIKGFFLFAIPPLDDASRSARCSSILKFNLLQTRCEFCGARTAADLACGGCQAE